jgi:hypothetical protein
MAICTNVAMLASRVMAPAAFAQWLGDFLKPENLTPLRRPKNAHHHGLNFSRAWGLWAIAHATDDPRWLELYWAHVEAGFADESHWSGNYRTVAHWVAQFGIYALQPVFGPLQGR